MNTKTLILLIVRIVAICLLVVAACGHLIHSDSFSIDVDTSFHAGWFGLAMLAVCGLIDGKAVV